jgi:hypothetical protein
VLAAKPFHELRKADGGMVPAFTVVIDTDRPDERLLNDGIVDACIPVGLTHDDIAVLNATPVSFGPIVEAIVREMAYMLDPEDCRNGARTTRCLAQLAFEFHRDAIAAELNHCIRAFKHREGYDEIIPVVTGSTGGGTGSSLMILLAYALSQPDFRSSVFQGLTQGLFYKPTAFVVEPFYRAQAHAGNPIHVTKILGNAMAFRIESALLERQKCFKNVYHLGLSNSGGAVLDTESDVARVLGTSLYQFEKHWASHVKPRTVDTADSHAVFGRYLGEDVPERIFPELRPTQLPTTPPPNGQRPNSQPPSSSTSPPHKR